MKILQENLENSSSRYKYSYDRKTKLKDIKVGDKVLIMQQKSSCLHMQLLQNIIINEELNQDQLNELKEIINRHQIIFSNKPGAGKIECHEISLTINVPIITRPYKIPFAN